MRDDPKFGVTSWEKVTANGFWPVYVGFGHDDADYDGGGPPEEDEIKLCRTWIRAHVIHTGRVNRGSGTIGFSYHLKHVVEGSNKNFVDGYSMYGNRVQYRQVDCSGNVWAANTYISNGAFIEAALREGYWAERCDQGSLNAYFNMKYIVSPQEVRKLARKKEKAEEKKRLDESHERVSAAREKMRAEKLRDTQSPLEVIDSAIAKYDSLLSDAADHIIVESKQRRRQRHKAVALPDCGGVYFLQTSLANDGPVKIGQATCIRKRIKSIQTSHPWPLRLIGYIPATDTNNRSKLEYDLHLRFEDSRMSGEWFRHTPEFLAAIITLPMFQRYSPNEA